MVEPDNIMLEHLRAIRTKLDQVEAKFDGRFDALTERMDGLELRLDGLTHAVIAGFGSVVHKLDAIKERVTRLETERA